MFITVVVPTHNEEREIRATLQALIDLDYAQVEIIVVDNSTDGTPSILQEFLSKGVRILAQTTGGGRSGARNLGIANASGDIVVVLNADVRLPRDFLRRVLPHYAAGADYVLVESKVANTKSLFARFVQAEHELYHPAADSDSWSEGFSCRRAALNDVGQFPVGFPVVIAAGEDGFLGDKLRERGYRKVIDRSIVVEHVAPSTVREFWNQQVGRGKGISQTRVLFRATPLWRAFLRVAIKTPWIVFRTLTLVSPAITVRALAKHSPRRRRDFPGFIYALTAQTLAYLLGEWIALIELARTSKGSAVS